MPQYNYKNTETGEIWTETRPMSERLTGVDGVRIVQVLSAPRLSYHSPENKRRRKDMEDLFAGVKKQMPAARAF